MSSQRRTPYVSVNLTVPARDALQRATFTLSAERGKRLPLSTVFLAALTVAEVHPEEFRAALVAEPDGEAQ